MSILLDLLFGYIDYGNLVYNILSYIRIFESKTYSEILNMAPYEFDMQIQFEQRISEEIQEKRKEHQKAEEAKAKAKQRKYK